MTQLTTFKTIVPQNLGHASTRFLILRPSQQYLACLIWSSILKFMADFVLQFEVLTIPWFQRPHDIEGLEDITLEQITTLLSQAERGSQNKLFNSQTCGLGPTSTTRIRATFASIAVTFDVDDDSILLHVLVDWLLQTCCPIVVMLWGSRKMLVQNLISTIPYTNQQTW